LSRQYRAIRAPAVLQELREDGMLNVGNKVVVIDAAGKRNEVASG